VKTLELDDVESGYGRKQVLNAVSLHVEQDESVALIGPNGAGKSTVLKVIAGVLPVWRGKMLFDGSVLWPSSPSARMRLGIGYAPQRRNVFRTLTVRENLEIGGYSVQRALHGKRIGETLNLFPRLREMLARHAFQLSGGEQQMLSLARALMTRPKLLLLDEPSLGLSPQLVDRVLEMVSTVPRELGAAVLLVEQKVKKVLRTSDRVYAMKLGSLSFDGLSEQLLDNEDKLRGLFL